MLRKQRPKFQINDTVIEKKPKQFISLRNHGRTSYRLSNIATYQSSGFMTFEDQKKIKPKIKYLTSRNSKSEILSRTEKNDINPRARPA